jgi:hypothetical protein
MNRRELLKTVAVLTGGAMVGAEFFLTGCKAGGTAAKFSEADVALLNEIAETIIPATDIPGAKAAKVGEFMKTMVTDCYTTAEQKTFMSGISSLQDACKKMHSKSFADCDVKQRQDFLVSLGKEAKTYNDKIGKEDGPKYAAHLATVESKYTVFEWQPKHYYSMMRELTIAGYFESEIGMTKAQEYVPVPGKYDGAFPYKKGDKAYSG